MSQVPCEATDPLCSMTEERTEAPTEEMACQKACSKAATAVVKTGGAGADKAEEGINLGLAVQRLRVLTASRDSLISANI